VNKKEEEKEEEKNESKMKICVNMKTVEKIIVTFV